MPTQVCWCAFTVPFSAVRALPKESGEQIRHKLQGQKTIIGFAGCFGFAFPSFFIKDVREFLVTHK